MPASWSALATSPFTVLTGPAGTGKTTLLKAWAAAEPESVLLTATTGIAAVNLGEGTTINALLKYFNTESLQEQFILGRLTASLWKLRKAGIQRILLDEMSMLDAAQLTVLTRAFLECNGQGYDLTGQDDEAGRACPPIGLTLAGDFCQLPPVKAPFAFESPEWEPHWAPNVLELTEVQRQQDGLFLDALYAIRRGEGHTAAPVFQPCYRGATNLRYDGVTIFAKNMAVDRHNQIRLDQLPGKPLSFASSRWGEQSPEWKSIPKVLMLKEGTLVMVLANRRISDSPANLTFEYINGDLGHLESGDGTSARVRLFRHPDQLTVIPPIVRQMKVPCDGPRRKELRAEGLEHRVTTDGKWEITGEIRYLPIRAAFASTVHKVQGITMDRVQINIRDGFFTHPGMIYVALSRCRALEGIDLVGGPATLAEKARVDDRVRGWL